MAVQLQLIADEGVEKLIVETLRKSFDVVHIAEFLQGSDDELILKLARNQNRILVTLDKDFGELVFRMAQVHSGVILCRLHAFQ